MKTDTMELPEQKAFRLIQGEVGRARCKHPEWPGDAIHAAAIVAEESGELVQAALQNHYEGGDAEAIETEAIQTAAMCIRLLCGRYKLPSISDDREVCLPIS